MSMIREKSRDSYISNTKAQIEEQKDEYFSLKEFIGGLFEGHS